MEPEQPSEANRYARVLTELRKLEEAWCVRYPGLEVAPFSDMSFKNGRVMRHNASASFATLIEGGNKEEADSCVRSLRSLPVLREALEEKLAATQEAEAERLRIMGPIVDTALATIEECL